MRVCLCVFVCMSAFDMYQEELEKMNHATHMQLHAMQMERIVSAAWFINFLPKLEEYSKRTATPIPSCCFQFLIVAKFVLMFDLKFTVDLFYKIIENTVAVEDHTKLVGEFLVYVCMVLIFQFH